MFSVALSGVSCDKPFTVFDPTQGLGSPLSVPVSSPLVRPQCVTTYKEECSTAYDQVCDPPSLSKGPPVQSQVRIVYSYSLKESFTKDPTAIDFHYCAKSSIFWLRSVWMWLSSSVTSMRPRCAWPAQWPHATPDWGKCVLIQRRWTAPRAGTPSRRPPASWPANSEYLDGVECNAHLLSAEAAPRWTFHPARQCPRSSAPLSSRWSARINQRRWELGHDDGEV